MTSAGRHAALGLMIVVGCTRPRPEPAPVAPSLVASPTTAPLVVAPAPPSPRGGPDQPDLRFGPGQRPGCDPMPGMDVDVPAPADQARACGDGVLGSYAVCRQTVGGGGCGGIAAPSPVRCLTAVEVCDGPNLGGASCRAHGFFGGRLGCAPTCTGVDVSACEPCRAGPGVACGQVPGVDHVDRLAIGDRAAALMWTDEGGDPRGWRLAIATARTVTVVPDAVVSWRAAGPAPVEVEVAWLGPGWAVWYLLDGHLWERRYDAAGRPAGAARDVASGIRALFADGHDRRGTRLAVALSTAAAPPRVFRLGAGGLGAEVPLAGPIAARRDDDQLVVLPIAGAAAGEADLAVLFTDRGTARAFMFKGGREFGSSSGDGLDLDLTLGTGRLTMTRTEPALITTWTPVGGAPWLVRHPRAAAPSHEPFAVHPAITDRRHRAAGKTALAVAVFRPPGGGPRLLTALVVGRRR